MGALKEFLHVLRGAARVLDGRFVVIKFNCANGAKCTLVAENKIDTFVFDKVVCSVTILGADFVIEESGKADLGDDVEFLPKEVNKELKAATLSAFHETFAWAIAAVGHHLTLAAAGGDADEHRDQKET